MQDPSDQTSRVALFTDSFYERDGVATLSRQLAQFARSRAFPYMLIHGGKETRCLQDGSSHTEELKRGVEHGVSGFLIEDLGGSLQRLISGHSRCASRCEEARKYTSKNSWQAVFERLSGTYAKGFALQGMAYGRQGLFTSATEVVASNF